MHNLVKEVMFSNFASVVSNEDGTVVLNFQTAIPDHVDSHKPIAPDNLHYVFAKDMSVIMNRDIARQFSKSLQEFVL
jgi:hypothetical protein